jgi:hypothetical protein
MSKPKPTPERQKELKRVSLKKVSLRMPKEDLQEFELLAVHYHVTISDVLRWALHEYLDPENPVNI